MMFERNKLAAILRHCFDCFTIGQRYIRFVKAAARSDQGRTNDDSYCLVQAMVAGCSAACLRERGGSEH